MAFYYIPSTVQEAVVKTPFRQLSNLNYVVCHSGGSNSWYYISTEHDGYNILSFSTAPGAKFTSKEWGIKIVEYWNSK